MTNILKITNRLKSCPFCKGKAKIIIKDWDNKADEYKIKCSKCGISQENYTFDIEEAIFNWNKRLVIENIITKIKEYQSEVPISIKKYITGILNLINWEDKDNNEKGVK